MTPLEVVRTATYCMPRWGCRGDEESCFWSAISLTCGGYERHAPTSDKLAQNHALAKVAQRQPSWRAAARGSSTSCTK